jgi:hypothetical protein
VSPVKYELGFYIPEDDILHSHCRENLKSYVTKMKAVYSSKVLVPVCQITLRVFPFLRAATISHSDRHHFSATAITPACSMSAFTG